MIKPPSASRIGHCLTLSFTSMQVFPSSPSPKERLEALEDWVQPILPLASAVFAKVQIVSGPFDCQQQRLSGDQLQSLFDLLDRTERITCAVDKKSASVEFGQVFGPELGGVARRVQWIGKQEQSFYDMGIFRGRDRRLPAAIGVSSQKDSSRSEFPKCPDSFNKSLAVMRSIAGTRRTKWPHLAEGQVAAQDQTSCPSKSICHRPQQRRLAV